MIRTLIADDQEAVRRSVRRILDAQPDIEVVGEAADGLAALELAAELRPDVALVDIRMPRLDGLEVTRRLAGPGVAEPVRVVVLTTFDLDEYVYPALRHGASGFLLKRSGPSLLAEAVRAAADGESLISPSVTVRLLKHVTAPRRSGPSAPVVLLTEREVEIAGQVAAGRTNADIAAELFISPGTVKTHVASIQRKLGVANRVGIAVHAWEMGYAVPN
ncbi:LuxR family two component transcriptional regulator [Streptomyces sp. 1114.5]|uniref:response regulator n=1 Tax=Streptomyces sp. 1114.5 TaxID=1938830 RepID=UPI000F1453F4|nr:response regulator transcription factor [Streptomyces sp. 1114.5]RKT12019.1 LuxR family two component transcriptional regulator [Streptomyces sp. 1114.5]